MLIQKSVQLGYGVKIVNQNSMLQEVHMKTTILLSAVALATICVSGQAATFQPQPYGQQTPLPHSKLTAWANQPNSRIHLNGFLSAGVMSTDNKALYLVQDHGLVNNEANFTNNSLIGLQFGFFITPKLSAITQLVASGDNSNGKTKYAVNAEWAFVRYQLNKYVQVRTGRFRLPAFVYSETQDVDYTYPMIYLPNEVYRIIPFSNMNGVDVSLAAPLGNSSFTASIDGLWGANTNRYDLVLKLPNLGYTVAPANFTEDNILGSVVKIGNQNLTLRGAYLRTDLTSKVDQGKQNPLITKSSVNFYSFGGKFERNSIVASAEYAARSTSKDITSLEGYDGMLGVRIQKFLPYVMYAHLKTTNNPTAGVLKEAQESYTGGIDYYLNNNVLLKAGISDVRPLDNTIGLFQEDPGKKNVLLYSASINAVF